MKFTILLRPKAQKRARTGAVRRGAAVFSVTYKEQAQELEENKLISCLLRERPKLPFAGPILLGVRAYLPIPESKPKKFKVAAQAGDIRPTTKPDLDNLLKHFKDCCKGIFWMDDKQVVGYLPETGKYYGFPPRWEIEIKVLNKL